MQWRMLLIGLMVQCHFCVWGQSGVVVLDIEGVDVGKGGDISAGVFSEKNFLRVGEHLTGVVTRVTGEKMQVELTGVPPGDYAIAVFQDIDQSKSLNTNFLGFPQEPLGFSNDARIRFGPPSFKDARVTIAANERLTVKIILR